MDAAIHAHHACVRRVLLRNDGYESQTEGDRSVPIMVPEWGHLACQVRLI